jgi:hypothetical protein
MQIYFPRVDANVCKKYNYAVSEGFLAQMTEVEFPYVGNIVPEPEKYFLSLENAFLTLGEDFRGFGNAFCPAKKAIKMWEMYFSEEKENK